MSDRTTSTAAKTAEDADRKTMQVAIAEKEKKLPLKEITKLSSVFSNEDFIKRLEQAVPKQLTPNRMLRSLVGSVQRSPDLLKCGILDVVGKMLVCASAGLETDTPLGHAHLIPFKKRTKNRTTGKWEEGYICQVIFGYHGLLDLSYRTGMLATVNARCVWKTEEDARAFSFEFGTQRHLRHRPMGGNHDLTPEAQAAGKADWPAYAYAHATMKDGYGDPFEVMNWADVMAIRDKAQAYQAALRALEDGRKASTPYIPNTWTEAPWVRHVRAMAAKTAFRQLSNWLPRSIELATVNAVEDAQERGGVDFGMVIDSNDYMAAAAEVSSDGGGEAFGVREEDPGEDDVDASLGKKVETRTEPKKAADKPPPTRQESPKADAKPPVQEQRQASPASADVFEGGAVDEIGEPIFDVGRDGLFDSPGAWAQWFDLAARNTTNIEALFENNSDAAGDAAKRDPAAGAVIMDALAAARKRLAPAEDDTSYSAPAFEEPKEDAGPQPIAVPTTPAGKRSWQGYWPLAKAAIAALPDASAVDAWAALNAPIYGESAAVTANIEQALGNRRIDFAQPAEPKPDRDRGYADEYMRKIKAAQTENDMAAIERMTAYVTQMRRWQAERTDLFNEVHDRMDERRAEIRAGRMEG